jgi:predicted nucleotidyltransferase
MRNTCNDEYTALQRGIFSTLCRTAGSKINQRGLATRLHVSPAAVSRALPRLERDGLVVVRGHGAMNLKEIELDRDNRLAVQLKRAENLRGLYLSGLPEHLAEIYAGCTIILFGSHARGEDTIRSDIDIAIIGSAEKVTDLAPYRARLEREVRLTCLGSINGLAKEFKENLFNGIVLVGGITL